MQQKSPEVVQKSSTVPQEDSKNIDLENVEKTFRNLGFASLLRRLPEIGLTEAPPPGKIAQAALDIGPLEFDPDNSDIYGVGSGEGELVEKILNLHIKNYIEN